MIKMDEIEEFHNEIADRLKKEDKPIAERIAFGNDAGNDFIAEERDITFPDVKNILSAVGGSIEQMEAAVSEKKNIGRTDAISVKKAGDDNEKKVSVKGSVPMMIHNELKYSFREHLDLIRNNFAFASHFHIGTQIGASMRNDGQNSEPPPRNIVDSYVEKFLSQNLNDMPFLLSENCLSRYASGSGDHRAYMQQLKNTYGKYVFADSVLGASGSDAITNQESYLEKMYYHILSGSSGLNDSDFAIMTSETILKMFNSVDESKRKQIAAEADRFREKASYITSDQAFVELKQKFFKTIDAIVDGTREEEELFKVLVKMQNNIDGIVTHAQNKGGNMFDAQFAKFSDIVGRDYEESISESNQYTEGISSEYKEANRQIALLEIKAKETPLSADERTELALLNKKINDIEIRAEKNKEIVNSYAKLQLDFGKLQNLDAVIIAGCASKKQFSQYFDAETETERKDDRKAFLELINSQLRHDVNGENRAIFSEAEALEIFNTMVAKFKEIDSPENAQMLSVYRDDDFFFKEELTAVAFKTDVSNRIFQKIINDNANIKEKYNRLFSGDPKMFKTSLDDLVKNAFSLNALSGAEKIQIVDPSGGIIDKDLKIAVEEVANFIKITHSNLSPKQKQELLQSDIIQTGLDKNEKEAVGKILEESHQQFLEQSDPSSLYTPTKESDTARVLSDALNHSAYIKNALKMTNFSGNTFRERVTSGHNLAKLGGLMLRGSSAVAFNSCLKHAVAPVGNGSMEKNMSNTSKECIDKYKQDIQKNQDKLKQAQQEIASFQGQNIILMAILPLVMLAKLRADIMNDLTKAKEMDFNNLLVKELAFVTNAKTIQEGMAKKDIVTAENMGMSLATIDTAVVEDYSKELRLAHLERTINGVTGENTYSGRELSEKELNNLVETLRDSEAIDGVSKSESIDVARVAVLEAFTKIANGAEASVFGTKEEFIAKNSLDQSEARLVEEYCIDKNNKVTYESINDAIKQAEIDKKLYQERLDLLADKYKELRKKYPDEREQKFDETPSSIVEEYKDLQLKILDVNKIISLIKKISSLEKIGEEIQTLFDERRVLSLDSLEKLTKNVEIFAEQNSFNPQKTSIFFTTKQKILDGLATNGNSVTKMVKTLFGSGMDMGPKDVLLALKDQVVNGKIDKDEYSSAIKSLFGLQNQKNIDSMFSLQGFNNGANVANTLLRASTTVMTQSENPTIASLFNKIANGQGTDFAARMTLNAAKSLMKR